MYQALYRKYRPRTFDDVVGQDYVIKTLKNSIIYNRISHAYMFFGPRGIGKTTIAKIFARVVNCENPVEGNPCEKCSSCLKSSEKETVDIIEIDAASNNGVDEIREIKSKVNIVPSDLKYKVYIIDEVHMLTSGAFNALLKTLEEPPKHVIFILATTDPQKVSETIVSRCQCYSFKRIGVNFIVQKLKQICQEESIKIEENVLEQIAISSNGGLRDSISSLDKLSSYKQDLITLEDYLEVNDLISNKEIEEFIDSILSGHIKNFILTINQYNDSGKNLVEIINQVIYYLKDVLVHYYLENNILKYELEDYQSLVNLLNERMFNIKKAADPKIYIELMILKFMENLHHEKKSTSISQKIEPEEKNPMNDSQDESLSTHETFEKKNLNSNNQSNVKEIMKIRLNNALAQADKLEKQQCELNFQKLNESVFNQQIGYIVSELLNSTIRVVSKDIIIISYEYDSVVDQNLKEIKLFQKVLTDLTEINKKIGIITDEMWEIEKQKYIKATKNKQKYDIIEEPELIEGENENEESDPSLLTEFGDIVEIN